jgi:hypothetical protein
MSTEPLDLKISSVLPYLFLIIGAPLFWSISWLARGVDWWLWLAGGMFAASLAYVVAAPLLVAKQRKSADWYRNLDRLAWFALLVAIGGYLIRDVFAIGTVQVENATPLDVRVMVDGEKWIDLPARSTRKETLPRGTHIVSVMAQEGEQKLDEHPAKVEDCGTYVLNIFGAQAFHRGEIVYGGAESPKPRVIQAKWFEVAAVDYLLTEPPKEVDGMSEGSAVIRKTYLLRAEPRLPKAK